MSNETKTGYKYRIGFHQSLTTGVIGFEGNTQFDWPVLKDDMVVVGNDYDNELLTMLKRTEARFKQAGYRVASDIEPKTQQVKNGQSDKEVKGQI